jgi:predicted  nucleic acid-binding Zn-ribbon protein
MYTGLRRELVHEQAENTELESKLELLSSEVEAKTRKMQLLESTDRSAYIEAKETNLQLRGKNDLLSQSWRPRTAKCNSSRALTGPV